MMSRPRPVLALCFTLLAGLVASPMGALSVPKDQSRIEDDTTGGTKAPESTPAEPPAEVTPPEEEPPQDLRVEDIPAIETVELTEDAAKRALDAYAQVRDKYNEQGLDDYETLEEFVSKTEAGKRLEAEIKGYGFKDITEWNTTIMTVGFAYNALQDSQEEAIRQQIEEVKNDKELEEAARNRMVASLSALLPSQHNKDVLKQLLKDPVYGDKLKLLDDVE
jgi:hypothetical protein